jgi:hypothetical protein
MYDERPSHQFCLHDSHDSMHSRVDTRGYPGCRALRPLQFGFATLVGKDLVHQLLDLVRFVGEDLAIAAKLRVVHLLGGRVGHFKSPCALLGLLTGDGDPWDSLFERLLESVELGPVPSPTAVCNVYFRGHSVVCS